MSRFLRRLVSAIAMWTIALAVIFSGNDVVFLLFISSLGFISLWEYFNMIQRSGRQCFKAFGLTSGAASFLGTFLYLRARGIESAYDFELAMLLVFLIGVFARQTFRPVAKATPLEAMAYTLFGLLYVAWLFNFITKIVYLVPRAPDGSLLGQFYVLYLIVVTKFSDMGAYLVGSRFGRHQMAPHISPGKTWEGFVGSFLFSILGSYLVIWLLPHQLHYLNFAHGTALGFLIGVAAVGGDLGESMIKRSTGVKDSGSVLPGIGGILDLVDSILFTAPLMYFYLRFVLK
ncbi:MAG TPA: phosphatidate cytidylyltransferase [Chthoniobacterales bacterium]